MDGLAKRIQRIPVNSHYPFWHELSDKEKKAIHNSRDYIFISVIDGIPGRLLDVIYKSIQIRDEYRCFYNELQKQWISDMIWYLGEKIHGDARRSQELSEKMLEEHLCERFRLYFAAKNPNKIEVIHENKFVRDFLSEVNREIGKANKSA